MTEFLPFSSFSPRRTAVNARFGLFASASGLALLVGLAAPASAQYASGGTVQLPPVSVEGNDTSSTSSGEYKADQPTMRQLTEPLNDTPQTIDAVPRQLMDDQAATTLHDTLRNVPGISLAAGENSSQGDNLTIRGFSARSDIFIDGMRDFGSYYRDPFYLDEVQVLKGPSSILFGRGSTGGVVEQDSKAARLSPITAGTVSFGTDMTKRVTADYDRALPELGDGAAFRINLMAHDSDVADRDVTENSRFGIAPTLALGIGTPTRLTFSYLHQSEYDVPDYGLPIVYQANAGSTNAIAHPVPLSQAQSNFYGFSNGDYLRANVDVATAKIEHDFNTSTSIRDQVRYGNYNRQWRITEAQIDTPGTNTAALISPNTPLSSLSVTRNQLYGAGLDTNLENQFDVTTRFRTGSINHTVVAGLELTHETSAPIRNTTIAPFSTTSLLTPNPDQAYNANTYYASRTNVVANGGGAYALDTVKFNDQWEVMAGGRFDIFDTNYFNQNFNNPVTGTGAGQLSLSHSDEMPSWRAAIVYKPMINGTFYVDGGSSFDPSAESLSLTSTTALSANSLDPVENITYEGGTKWDVLDGALTLQGSVFRSQQLNVRETDPNNSALNILAGDAIAEGTELQAVGRITNQWQVLAGYAYTFSVIDKSPNTTAASDLGHRLGNVPMHTANLWTTYTFPFKLQIGGGPQYVGSRFTSTTATTVGGVNFWKEVPGYVTLGLMAKYPVTDNMTAQLNLYNITGTEYYDQLHPSHIVPGAGPSALLTLAMKY